MVKDVDLSIIVPTYNRGYVIGRAIQSILNQTYADFEILVVDDASTDNTHEIVQSINDDRIRYIRHERNKGAAAARNTAITAAKGDYIAFLDSDDEWLPEYLEKQMTVFRNASSKVGAVYTGMLHVEGDNRTYIPPPYVTHREGNIYYTLFRDPMIVHPSTTVIRRECFTKVGMFDERFRPLGDDNDLWIRIAKYYDFKYIYEPLVLRYAMPDSIAADRASYIRSQEMILEKHFEDIRKDRRTLARFYINLGDTLCSQRRFREGRRYFIKATIAHSSGIASLLLYLASLTGQTGYDKATSSYRKIREWWFTRKRRHVSTSQMASEANSIGMKHDS